MLKELYDRIRETAKTELLLTGNEVYSTKPIHRVRELNDEIKTMPINTLTGIVDYIDANIDEIDLTEIFIHIYTFSKVYIVSKLDVYRKRQCILESSMVENSFPFRNYISAEDFNIQLQTNFVPNDDRATILALIGNLKEEVVRTTNDDGVSQSVTTKKGISLGQQERVPNPVKLRPYRTFREIEQPESLFVFRMRDGAQCALFPADGNQWKLDAISNIAKWLGEKIGSEIPIIA